MSYLLRLVLPDRPGTLGAVATALGQVGADILSLDVIERSAEGATDDIVVELPPDKLADTVVSAALTIPGVRVESIRPYAGQVDPHRELELLERLAEQREDALHVLADGVARVFRAGWALVLDTAAESEDGRGVSKVLAASTAAPEIDELEVPWWPPAPVRSLEAADPWCPADWDRLGTELAIAPLGPYALLVGRPALRWLPSELVRLHHLAVIASSVTLSP
jgi:hypothetical protein